MIARRYSHKIEIWHNTLVSDGYGGNILTPALVKSVWAEMKSGAGTKYQGAGFANFINPVIFRIRGKSNNLNLTEKHFVKYKGKAYQIKGIEDVNLENREVNLFCDGE